MAIMPHISYIGMADSEILQDIGSRLRALRGTRRQQEVARQAGLTRQTVARAEQGENPTALTIIRLLRAYGRLGALEAFIPDAEVSPMALLRKTRPRSKRGADA